MSSPAAVSNQLVNQGTNLSACGFAGEFGVGSGGFLSFSEETRADYLKHVQMIGKTIAPHSIYGSTPPYLPALATQHRTRQYWVDRATFA